MALALLALAATLGACGGGSTDGVGSAEGTIATPRSDTTAQGEGRGGGRGARGSARAAASCAEAGILAPPYREGACIERGTRLVVANGKSLMRLRTLNASLRGFSVVEQVGRHLPQGAFLVVRLSVENKTGQAVRFSPGQTQLIIAEQQFEERADVERSGLQDALAHAGRKPIAPGETVAGSVVFDIPISTIETVTREGNLGVANFDGNPPGKQPELGYFRIYLQ